MIRILLALTVLAAASAVPLPPGPVTIVPSQTLSTPTEQIPEVHYRCDKTADLTVLTPVDCSVCKTETFSCVNCLCAGDK
jgi:hypothetical protein